jgi:hypothetical protein
MEFGEKCSLAGSPNVPCDKKAYDTLIAVTKTSLPEMMTSKPSVMRASDGSRGKRINSRM